jgi:hypothetical protein
MQPMKTLIVLAIAAQLTLILELNGACETKLPQELSGLKLGMTYEELLKARPHIQKPISWDDRMPPKNLPHKEFLNSSKFDHAVYLIRSDRLDVIQLFSLAGITRSSKKIRSATFDYCIQIWGKPTSITVGHLGTSTHKTKVPAAIWKLPDVEIHLFGLASKGAFKKSSVAILRLSKPTKKPYQGFKQVDLAPDEKERIISEFGFRSQ